ncbi:MAG TPA: hypothetical protein VE196_08645, partial [Pseudonocardiaceae bacterium]|nr:hypothetical protein [Pseudonocardiaceae bacterium]
SLTRVHCRLIEVQRRWTHAYPGPSARRHHRCTKPTTSKHSDRGRSRYWRDVLQRGDGAAPIDQVDLEQWIFSLSDAEYQQAAAARDATSATFGCTVE